MVEESGAEWGMREWKKGRGVPKQMNLKNGGEGKAKLLPERHGRIGRIGGGGGGRKAIKRAVAFLEWPASSAEQ